jgi:hypothetical protein
MYELAVQINKSRNDLLWLAIIGVTDHFVEEHLDSGSYQKLLALLRDEVWLCSAFVLAVTRLTSLH